MMMSTLMMMSILMMINTVKTWRLWLSYLGANHSGFQKQSGLKTIEKTLENAFLRLLGFIPPIVVAGRTDTGVHARGQVISTIFKSKFSPDKLPFALTHFTRPNIIVYRSDIMESEFNAKNHSIGKRYVYRINQTTDMLAFNYKVAWNINTKLNIEAMKEASKYLIGEHNFESFRGASCNSTTAMRYIWKIEIDHCVNIDIRGNAFCYNMVRIIVGTLVDIGLNKLHQTDMKRILIKRERALAGRTAPAHGLCLEEIYYPDNIINAGIPENASFPRYPIKKGIFK